MNSKFDNEFDDGPTATDNEYDEAADRFAAFHGREPEDDSDEIIETETGEVAFLVGDLYGIMYKLPGTSEPYVHKFNANDRPLLYFTADGKQIVVLKGDYDFTEKGIEG